MELSNTFTKKLEAAWGHPHQVVAAAQDELFRVVQEDGDSLDHDEQVTWAMELGILAGQTQHQTPEEFTHSFIKLLKERNE